MAVGEIKFSELPVGDPIQDADIAPWVQSGVNVKQPGSAVVTYTRNSLSGSYGIDYNNSTGEIKLNPMTQGQLIVGVTGDDPLAGDLMSSDGSINIDTSTNGQIDLTTTDAPSSYGDYTFTLDGENTSGAIDITAYYSKYSKLGNLVLPTITIRFIPTSVTPTIAFIANFSEDIFSTIDQAGGTGTVRLLASPTGSDGSCGIYSIPDSPSIGLSLVTPDQDSSKGYEVQINCSYEGLAAPLPFISIWDTSPTLLEVSSHTMTGDNQIQLPLVSDGTYNFIADWGDGNTDHITAWDQAEVTHTYDSPGVYTVTLTGLIKGWSFGVADTDNQKILEITQWGSLIFDGFSIVGGYFYQCTNLTISALDTLSFAPISLYQAFQSCSSLTNIPSINDWDFSVLANVTNAFRDCVSFSQNLLGIGAANLTDVDNAFSGCSLFNGDISNWNLSSCVSISGILQNCSSFSGDVSSWDVSGCSDFSSAFQGCTLFNSDISSFNMSSALNINNMLRSCPAFDKDLSGWNIVNLTDATDFLTDSTLSVPNYDALLIAWADESVQSFVTFSGGNSQYSSSAVTARTTLTDTYNWSITDGGQVSETIMVWDTEALGELPGETVLTLPLVSTGSYDFYVDWGDGNIDHITAWDQAEVSHTYGSPGTYTTSIFGTIVGWHFFDYYNSSVQIIELQLWGSLRLDNGTINGGYFYNTYNMAITATDIPDLTGVTSFNQAFWSSYLPTGIPNVDLWDVSAITDMSQCFKFSAFDGTGLNSWDVSNVTNMSGMFWGSAMNTLLDSWVTTNCTDMSFMFNQSSYNQSLNTFDMTNVTSIAWMLASTAFNNDIYLWTLPNCIDATGFLDNATSFNKNFVTTGHWHTPSVQSFANFLTNASSFNFPMDLLDVSSCTDFTEMFRQTIFDQPLPSWNTQNAEHFNAMFRLCPFSQDISMWDLSNGPELSAMFWQASYSDTVPLFDVSACSVFTLMFAESSFNNPNVASFNMSNATDISAMFYGNIAFNQELSWDTSSVTSCDSCFEGCTSFNSLLPGWIITSNSTQRMFYGCSLLNKSFASWTFQNVANCSYMFSGCTALDQDFSTFGMQNMSLAFAMFSGVTLSNANYNKTLVGWDSQPPNISVFFDGGNSHYDTTSGGVNGVAAHNDLTGFYGWTITDGGTP